LLIALIRVSEIRDVMTLPLKKNLVPRFMKGGGAQETMKDALVVEIRGYRDAVSHAAFPSMHG
jgi:hypothetical protein